MLIPRFSLRWLLIIMTLCGVVAFVLAQAVDGAAWAISIAVAIASLLMTFIVYVVAFLGAWGIASIGSVARKRHAASPFATHTPPPQILPPEEPV